MSVYRSLVLVTASLPVHGQPVRRFEKLETGTVKSQGGIPGGDAGITNHIKLFSPLQPRCAVSSPEFPGCRPDR